MKWFKHDADAHVDSKLQSLMLDYGAAGYGLYWYCVELIVHGVSDTNITFELEHDARIIARNLNLSVQETKDMMKRMVELGLFSISTNEKLACYALIKRLDKSMTSNEKMRNLIAEVRESHDYLPKSHDSVMMNSDLVMQDKTRLDKNRLDKRRKEDIVERFTFTLKQNFSFSSLSDEYRNKLYAYAVTRDSGTEYQRFEDFHVAKGSKFKDWSRAYSTWLQNAVKFGGTTNTPVITNVQGEDCILIGDKAVKIATLEIVPISRRVVEQTIDQDFVNASGYNVSGLLSDLAKEKAI